MEGKKGLGKGGSKPFVQLPRRSKLTLFAEEAVPSDSDRDGVAMLLGWVRGWVSAQEVAANDDFGLNDGFTAKNYIRCADYLGAARYFVSGILCRMSCVLSFVIEMKER